MAPLLSDAAVIERVLAHIEAGTTDTSEGCWREPVANYRSQARLDAELALLRRLPAAYCPSAALPEPGSYVAREAAGTPLLVVRGSDGRVRAFRNACRHRGMQLASGSGCAAAFACRYHGWTYGLDGSLRHVPHADGFPGLDKERHGLVPVAAVERGGLVWVSQSGERAGLDALDDFPELVAKDQRLLETRGEFLVPANWKIFLEGFLEGYHIKTTHPTSFLPYGFDNLNVIESFGRNSRVTFPFQRIQKQAALPPEQRRIDGTVTYVYQIFPNAVLNVLSRHTVMVVLEPISLEATRAVSYVLTNRAEGDTDAEREAKRDAAFVTSTGAVEDAQMVAAIQKSIACGANEHFTFGRFEGAIQHFHRELGALLTGSGSAAR